MEEGLIDLCTSRIVRVFIGFSRTFSLAAQGSTEVDSWSDKPWCWRSCSYCGSPAEAQCLRDSRDVILAAGALLGKGEWVQKPEWATNGKSHFCLILRGPSALCSGVIHLDAPGMWWDHEMYGWVSGPPKALHSFLLISRLHAVLFLVWHKIS